MVAQEVGRGEEGEEGEEVEAEGRGGAEAAEVGGRRRRQYRGAQAPRTRRAAPPHTHHSPHPTQVYEERSGRRGRRSRDGNRKRWRCSTRPAAGSTGAEDGGQGGASPNPLTKSVEVSPGRTTTVAGAGAPYGREAARSGVALGAGNRV